MIEELLKSANGPLRELLASVGGSGDSADAVRDSFAKVIREQTKEGNYEGVMEMFSGKETSPESPTVEHLKGNLGNKLSDKLGIDTDKALAIAGQALPLLLNIFNKKVNDAPQANEEVAGSVVKSIKEEDEAGLGSVLSSIFGSGENPSSIDLGSVIDLGAGLFKKK